MGTMPYTALQSMFHAIYPPGLQWYWRGDFLGKIPEEAIDQHLEFGKALPTLHSTMHCYPVDGFPSRVGRHETAFSYRGAKNLSENVQASLRTIRWIMAILIQASLVRGLIS